MTQFQTSRSDGSQGANRLGRLFLLELSGGRIHSMNPDGSDRKTIVTDCRMPDGIAVDTDAGHIYWTNMGDLRVRPHEPRVILNMIEIGALQ